MDSDSRCVLQLIEAFDYWDLEKPVTDASSEDDDLFGMRSDVLSASFHNWIMISMPQIVVKPIAEHDLSMNDWNNELVEQRANQPQTTHMRKSG